MNPQVLAEHHLTLDEYEHIVKAIGREPSRTELGIFSVMWSEHCSYKSSRVHLSTFPTTGPQVIQGPGENAGVIALTDTLGLAFKMESHNHPSYIEPYQGAATGVGGILRDVFTMGARPIALLNSLRFGDAKHPKTSSLVRGVVAGIGGYGNCMGIPTVGGEVQSDASYNGNILVNAMAVGLVRRDEIFLGTASGVGNPVIYVGSRTGRDGIHGATMASDVFGEGNEARRPTVQVGDPFVEKLLLEACLEAMRTGVVLGIQDMGAAGLTSSSFEMAARAGNGLQMNLDLVPQRETEMTAYEMMLSESQERMLMVVEKGREAPVLAIFEKWGLAATVVGEVTDTGRVVITHNGHIECDLPVGPVVDDAPKYRRPMQEPRYLAATRAYDFEKIAQPTDWNATVLTLLGSPNIASKAWVYGQYDQQVGTATVVLPGSDAAVLRIHGEKIGVAISTDCNSRYCYLDPYWGAAHAVVEAARNVVCSGAYPQAITDCLNFGSPEDPEIMWQFAECVKGLSEACRQLSTPVVSGNVSLYNATGDTAIYPTPSVGMVGVLRNVEKHCRQGFAADGDIVAVLGDIGGTLGGSEYLARVHDTVAGTIPEIDFAKEHAMQQCCIAAIEAGLLQSAHDCSEGGLAVAIAESCLTGRTPRGASIALPPSAERADALLFGEGSSRLLVSCAAAQWDALQDLALQRKVAITQIGAVGGDRLQIGEWIDIPVAECASVWTTSFEKKMVN